MGIQSRAVLPIGLSVSGPLTCSMQSAARAFIIRLPVVSAADTLSTCVLHSRSRLYLNEYGYGYVYMPGSVQFGLLGIVLCGLVVSLASEC